MHAREDRVLSDPQVEKAVFEKWQSDAGFRTALESDAAGTLSGMGIAIPEGIVVRVFDDEKGIKTLVIGEIVEETAELTDEDLEKVAGGAGGITASFGGLMMTVMYGVLPIRQD